METISSRISFYTAIAVLTVFVTTIIVVCLKIAFGSHGGKDRLANVEEQVREPVTSTPATRSEPVCTCGPPEPLLVNKWTQDITNEVVYKSFKNIKQSRANAVREKTLKRQRSDPELDSSNQYISLTPRLSAPAKPFFPHLSVSTPEPKYTTVRPLGARERTPRAILGRSASFSEGSRTGPFVSNTFLRGKQVNHYSSIAENHEKEGC